VYSYGINAAFKICMFLKTFDSEKVARGHSARTPFPVDVQVNFQKRNDIDGMPFLAFSVSDKNR